MNDAPDMVGAHLVPMFVYFIQCGDAGGPVKIGRAIDAERRIQELQVGNPFALTLLASLLVDDAERLEADLHAKFDAYHIRGEWFAGSYPVRSAAVQMSRLATRQRAQLAACGAAVFEWRGVVRESVEMPDPGALVSVPLGSRVADPKKLRPARAGYWWRGKWRT